MNNFNDYRDQMLQEIDIRIDNQSKLSEEQYTMYHSEPLRATQFQINLNLFETQIEPYKPYRRQWGPEYTYLPRYGLPLTNLTGRLDDPEDPSCAPLDTLYNHTGQLYIDRDFTTPTEILDQSCFDPINSIKPLMYRSSILWWDTLGHFKPHVDTMKDRCTSIRLWGTNVTDYYLTFNGKQYDYEPGRLYLIDTSLIHEARAYSDFTCTFFLCFSLGVLDHLWN